MCRSSHPGGIATTSALGQKQTSAYVRGMSALPPKADIATQPWNVRFVPKADSCGAAKEAHLPQALRSERDVSKLIAPRAKAALGSKELRSSTRKRSGAPIKLVQGSRISLPLTQVRVRPLAALATGQIHAGKLKRGLGGSALHLRRAPGLVL